MQIFEIELTSFRQVQDFVKLAAQQPFDIRVGNEWQSINAKDFMGMFSLDYSRPMRVCVECPQEAFESFRQEVYRILNK